MTDPATPVGDDAVALSDADFWNSTALDSGWSLGNESTETGSQQTDTQPNQDSETIDFSDDDGSTIYPLPVEGDADWTDPSTITNSPYLGHIDNYDPSQSYLIAGDHVIDPETGNEYVDTSSESDPGSEADEVYHDPRDPEYDEWRHDGEQGGLLFNNSDPITEMIGD